MVRSTRDMEPVPQRDGGVLSITIDSFLQTVKPDDVCPASPNSRCLKFDPSEKSISAFDVFIEPS
jgi:hypothetical protein